MFKKKKVLVVDDERISFFVKANLEARGAYRCQMACPASWGELACCRRHPAHRLPVSTASDACVSKKRADHVHPGDHAHSAA